MGNPWKEKPCPDCGKSIYFHESAEKPMCPDCVAKKYGLGKGPGDVIWKPPGEPVTPEQIAKALAKCGPLPSNAEDPDVEEFARDFEAHEQVREAGNVSRPTLPDWRAGMARMVKVRHGKAGEN